MKILIVNDYGRLTGGAEHMTVSLRDGLRARGHDARIFASTAAPLPLPVFADEVCYGTESGLGRVLQAANPMAARALARAIAEIRPDIVHVRMFMTQLSPLILPVLRRVPALLHVVNYQTICPLNTKVLPDGSPCVYRPGIACRRAGCVSLAGFGRVLVQHGLWRHWRDVFDIIVANSEWTLRRIRAEGVDASLAIHNGIPLRPPRPRLIDPPTIGYAGRLVTKKGVGVLLRAVARVADVVPDVRLIIAGDGPDRATVESDIRSLGLRERVTMHGHIDRADLEAALAGAWVQAVPSLWEEPFGLVAAEAMMRGTAVIASDAGGLTETVRHEQTGLLVPSGDHEALATALVRLLSDRKLAERMGGEGRIVAMAELTEDRVVERFLQVYAQLIARRDSPAGCATGHARRAASVDTNSTSARARSGQ